MKLAVLGIDHVYEAGIREKVAFSETQKVEFSAQLMELGACEVVILSTCNRSEVYFSTDGSEELLQRAIALYTDYFQIEAYRDCLTVYQDEAAVRHIFRVTAGLESAIPGEDEILRQMKQAYEFAHSFQNTGKFFNRLFQEAITCAKEIKSRLKISEIPVSTGYIGLRYLEQQMGTFADKHLLLLGFGEIGQLFYQYGKELPLRRITICNRSSAAVQAALEGQSRDVYRPFEDWREVLGDADAVITATACPHLILKAGEMPPRDKPVYMLDMAIPRNIDSRIDALAQYHVANVDVLKALASQNESSRQTLKRDAEGIIDRYLEEFQQWCSHAEVDTVIESLNHSVDEILDGYLEYLFRKISPNEREKRIITRTMHAALKRAVREPIITLKRIETPQKRALYSEVVEDLFGFHQEES